MGNTIFPNCFLRTLGIRNVLNDGEPMLHADNITEPLDSQPRKIEVLEFVRTVQRSGVENNMVE